MRQSFPSLNALAVVTGWCLSFENQWIVSLGFKPASIAVENSVFVTVQDKSQGQEIQSALKLELIYQEPDQIFAYAPLSISETAKKCLFVIDTNVLLIPFNTGKQPLDEIKRMYEQLAKEARLVIPGQVAREFASGRADKLTDLFYQLGRKRENVKIQTTEYPLLESLPEYQRLQEAERKAQEAIKI